jgi:hypothetical protein
VQGGFIVQGNNVKNGYYVYNVKDGNNVILAGGTGDNEHIFDFFSGASTTNDYLYGCVSLGGGMSHIYCCGNIVKGSNLYYCYLVRECSYCL